MLPRCSELRPAKCTERKGHGQKVSILYVNIVSVVTCTCTLHKAVVITSVFFTLTTYYTSTTSRRRARVLFPLPNAKLLLPRSPDDLATAAAAAAANLGSDLAGCSLRSLKLCFKWLNIPARATIAVRG